MRVIEVSALKGGVGTSTVATAIALELAKVYPDKVVLLDQSKYLDIFSIIGMGGYHRNRAEIIGENGLTVVGGEIEALEGALAFDIHSYEFVVIDAGTTPRDGDYFGVDPFRISVVANAYLSLRPHTVVKAHKIDAFVCVLNDGGVLNIGDVNNVLSQFKASMHVFKIDSSVARTIDAGLFVSRSTLYEAWVNELLADHNMKSAVSA